MRLKIYKTFRWHESHEEYLDEIIVVDLNTVTAVREDKFFSKENPMIEVFVPAGRFNIEMGLEDFLSDWKNEKGDGLNRQ